MPEETDDPVGAIDSNQLKTVPVAELERTIATAVTSLVGNNYRARIDSMDFEDKYFSRGKVRLLLRLERILPSLDSLLRSSRNGDEEHTGAE